MKTRLFSKAAWPPILLWATVVPVLLVFLVLAALARPFTDDYCVVYQSASAGFLDVQRYWYVNWTGRFTAALAYTLFAVSGLMEQYYWVAPASMLAGLAAGFYLLCRALLRDARPATVVVSALLVIAVYLAALPAPDQTLYWMTGAYSYQLGNILALVMLALGIASGTGPAGRALVLVLAILVTGTNEIMMVTLVAVTVVLAMRAWVTRRERGFMLALAMVTGLAAAVVILAPGNAVRGAAFSEGGDVLVSLTGSLVSTVEYVLKWSLSLPLLGLSMLALRYLPRSGPAIPGAGRGAPVLLWLGLIALCFLPAYWAMGHRPPERARVPIYLVFLVGWFLVWLPWLRASLQRQLARWDGAHLQRTGAIVLVAGLLVQGNFPGAASDLFTRDAIRYAAAHDLRSTVLAGARDADEVVLAALPVRPPTLLHEDITTDAGDWRNRCMAQYYHIGSLRVADKD